MAIPSYDKFYGPILEFLSDGKIHTFKETVEYCSDAFKLTEAEKKEMLPSQKSTVVKNRVGWAVTYLKNAGLLRNEVKGKYTITESGENSFKECGKSIDNKYLYKFDSFCEFMKKKKKKSSNDHEKVVLESEYTPQEIINSEYEIIIKKLSDDLMTNIMNQDASFFERLVMDLLEKMGYGGELSNPSEVTGKTGDEGTDGIIRQDVLGFDKIYVQAKHWSYDHVVGSPDIQQFAGALLGKGANKGLFITTSRFSKAAKEYVDKQKNANIVLVDGNMLTKLMIDYGLGVSTVHSYEIKRVDSDYFNDEED